MLHYHTLAPSERVFLCNGLDKSAQVTNFPKLQPRICLLNGKLLQTGQCRLPWGSTKHGHLGARWRITVSRKCAFLQLLRRKEVVSLKNELLLQGKEHYLLLMIQFNLSRNTRILENLSLPLWVFLLLNNQKDLRNGDLKEHLARHGGTCFQSGHEESRRKQVSFTLRPTWSMESFRTAKSTWKDSQRGRKEGGRGRI